MCTTMSEREGRDAHIVAPTLLVTVPAEGIANIDTKSTLAGRRRSKTESSALSEPGRASANEWIDVDHKDPARHKRSSKRRATASSGSQKSRAVEFDLGRFLPRLGRILETTDGTSASRPHIKAGNTRQKHEEGSRKTARHRIEQGDPHRRSVKHRVGGQSRQNQTNLKINPSLLSVISGLTGISDSSSNTTITQQSYNSRGGSTPESNGVHRRSDSALSISSSHTPDVFAFMEPALVEEDGHGGSSRSSSPSSSRYSPSEAGSSEAPQTPSSNSTFPSPTATRSGSLTGSVKELRLKYDAQFTSPVSSPMNSRHGSESGAESLNGQRLGAKATIHKRAHRNAASVHSEGSHDARSDRVASTDEQQRLPSVSQPPPHHAQPIYGGQHRSHSTSSADSAGSNGAYAQYMAMQQYQQPSAPVPASHFAPRQDSHGPVGHADRPPVPDAPDVSQKTLVGYEMLAEELASVESPVKPAYRKFEYLNHRILLHLQDELCEMEEQLRTMDEIIAQIATPAEGAKRSPASRRRDAFNGSEMHHRRTALLGRIFLKTEQYNRALSSFAALTKECRPAELEQVAAYRDWMAEKAPIHDVEVKFLQKQQDLVQLAVATSSQPHQDASSQSNSSKHAAALSCLPVALMLPLLLYSIIPTLAGRLIITMLIGISVFLVVATTHIRHMMPLNEWAVCGGAYVLIMATIAGCVPQHAA